MSINYGVSVYSTKGVSLHKINSKNPSHLKIKETKIQAKIIQNRLQKLNIQITQKDILDKLLEDRILEKKLIEITEPNQAFVYKDIENLIFVGANLDTFPVSIRKTPFYVKDLYEDDTYFASKLFFERMKSIANNMFIFYQKRQ